jgi:hypothetical protein
MTSNEQARADALADAETLRLVAWAVRPNGQVFYYCDEAMMAGDACRANLDSDYYAPLRASIAARAAFRAVPALRGE